MDFQLTSLLNYCLETKVSQVDTGVVRENIAEVRNYNYELICLVLFQELLRCHSDLFFEIGIKDSFRIKTTFISQAN